MLLKIVDTHNRLCTPCKSEVNRLWFGIIDYVGFITVAIIDYAFENFG